MKTESLGILALLALVLVPVVGIVSAQEAGTQTGTMNATNTKVINILASQLSIVVTATHKTGTTNGFNSNDMIISVANTPTGKQTIVDTPSLGSGTSVAAGKQYSSASLASDIAVNPALFKFVNITVPGVQNLTSTISWAAR